MFSRQANIGVIESAVTSFSIPQHTHLHMHTCTDHFWWGTQAVWHWGCAYVYLLRTLIFLTQKLICFYDCLYSSLSSVFAVRWILLPFEQQHHSDLESLQIWSRVLLCAAVCASMSSSHQMSLFRLIHLWQAAHKTLMLPELVTC